MTEATGSIPFNEIVSSVMNIQDVTWGDPKRDYVVRFRGTLTTDEINARDILFNALRPYKTSAVFQKEEGLTSILLLQDPITAIVTKVFQIETSEWAGTEKPHLAKFTGKLLKDSVEAYEILEKDLHPKNLTPLFRVENGVQAIVLIKGVSKASPSNPWNNLILFVLTLLSVMIVGAMNAGAGPSASALTGDPMRDLLLIYADALRNVSAGFPFAASLMAILLAHEFGHYIAGRIHKSPVTLPYFLPMPFPPFGTLGAFIQLKAAPKNKRVLHDIGIAGPLAGLAVAIPILLYGLSLSNVDALPRWIPEGGSLSLEGNSILYLLAKYVSFGEWLPSPASYGDTHPFIYWLKFFFTGRPSPLGGRDVLIHPVAFAGWVGILVTSLNLIPAGQLDGGHVIYVLLGKKARKLLPYVLLGLVVLGIYWSGWWFWAFLIFMLGRAYAEPLDQITELDPRRRLIAAFGILVFILVFTPIPFQVISGLGF